MSNSIKIAIIGDYNFTYNSHQATNLSLDHASRFLDIEINYYWIKVSEVNQVKPSYFEQYDGIWIAPGPFKNIFFLNGVIQTILKTEIPVLITGDGFKNFIEVIANNIHFNPNKEKLISDNLVEGQQFEQLQILPHSEAFLKLYKYHNTIELTSSRFSIYPHLLQQLKEETIDIEAYNEFEEPEVVTMKKHTFFLACGYSPQISSTRAIPHPVIYTFVKGCLEFHEKNVDL